jgi:hypothetical protein
MSVESGSFVGNAPCQLGVIVGGVLIGVLSFVLTAHSPRVNVWPFLGAGFVCTMIGVFLLMSEDRKSHDG